MVFFWIKEAFKSIGRAKSSFVLSLISTSISVLLIAASVISIQLSNKFQSDLKNKIKINVFLDDGFSKTKINDLENKLHNKEYINSIDFISKDEAAETFIKNTGEDFRKIIDYNPLPASFAVTLKQEFIRKNKIDEIVSEVSKMKGVDEVVYQYEFADQVLSFIDSFKKYIFIITGILILISVYIVYSTVKLVINLKEEELETMKLVGARLSTIKMPIIINGTFIGFLAGIIALGIFVLILNYFDNLIAFQSYMGIRNLDSSKIYIAALFLAGPALGFIVSLFALRKINLKF